MSRIPVARQLQVFIHSTGDWPPTDILMINDTTDINPEEAVPCIALSKNDSYVISAFDGRLS